MLINHEGLVLPILKVLCEKLELIISMSAHNESGAGVVINFRDPDYSAESGGYHPVEIAINAGGQIQYITDFSYVGQPPYAELDKELDFDFSSGLLYQLGQYRPIERALYLYPLWEQNFLAYYEAQVYTVEVSAL